MKILVTGGAGYIGSHTILELLKKDNSVTVIDNLSNSSEESLRRVINITGKKDLSFHEGDILDKILLNRIFSQEHYDAVIHFAGLKSVDESVKKPLLYYQNNVCGTLNLIEAMQEFNVYNLVFSSSATVYGKPSHLPINENCTIGASTNPYGTSKMMVEQILADLAISDKRWNIARLRYFNPVGAHESGQIGEDPRGVPNNLMPYISQVATGRLEKLYVYGDDYDTVDGTGVRDYIHVVDLAIGHLMALEKLQSQPGIITYNLGTGTGYSVFEIIKVFEKVNAVKIPYIVAPRREGDIASCYADPTYAMQELNWHTKRTLEDMARDVWRWQKNNPYGYSKE